MSHEINLQIDFPNIIPRNLPDINLYQNKKSVGTGLMDFALLVTNVNQLKHIISKFDSSDTYFYVSLSLVIISIILQIVLGICLTANCRYNVKDCDEICKADRINNWITALIFLIAAVNVVIPSFGVPEKDFWTHPVTMSDKFKSIAIKISFLFPLQRILCTYSILHCI